MLVSLNGVFREIGVLVVWFHVAVVMVLAICLPKGVLEVAMLRTCEADGGGSLRWMCPSFVVSFVGGRRRGVDSDGDVV